VIRRQILVGRIAEFIYTAAQTTRGTYLLVIASIATSESTGSMFCATVAAEMSVAMMAVDASDEGAEVHVPAARHGSSHCNSRECVQSDVIIDWQPTVEASRM